jgi:hypothetical protein
MKSNLWSFIMSMFVSALCSGLIFFSIGQSIELSNTERAVNAYEQKIELLEDSHKESMSLLFAELEGCRYSNQSMYLIIDSLVDIKPITKVVYVEKDTQPVVLSSVSDVDGFVSESIDTTYFGGDFLITDFDDPISWVPIDLYDYSASEDQWSELLNDVFDEYDTDFDTDFADYHQKSVVDSDKYPYSIYIAGQTLIWPGRATYGISASFITKNIYYSLGYMWGLRGIETSSPSGLTLSVGKRLRFK